MDPTSRRWWRLLDALPGRLGRVHRWFALPHDVITGTGHLHASPTAVVCLEGVVRIRRPHGVLDLQPGDALLVAPGVWHYHEPLKRGSSWYGQGFLAGWSDLAMGEPGREWRGKVPSHPSRQLIDRALSVDDADDRRAVFAELVGQVLGESVIEQVFAHPALRAMLKRMWSRLHHGVSVDDLVRASGLSRAHAYRVFAEGYGVPPKEALATARLWLADGLLGADLPVGEVARRCGYANAGTFSRAWKRAHGQPPRARRVAATA